ncbi:MAG: serine/threonine protein kinase [Magnetococcales bacterium]|nr:serine/threonine protein kinase [Magnetococcales bacterium]
MPTQSPLPDPGTALHIGGLQLRTLIKSGATGSIHAAVDTATGRMVAVKLFNHSPATADPGTPRYNPWEFIASLNHPNIIKIFGTGCENGQHYAIMELSSSGTLNTSQQHPLPRAITLARQILHALDHLHAHGQIHLDIKPGNLLLFPDNRLKVSDFGLMRPLRAPATRPMGSPGFMSPEQIMGLPLDQRSDLFSLGVVLYRMVTGRSPFGGRGVSDIIYRTLLITPPQPALLQPNLPTALSHVIMQALTKRPSQRLTHAADFLAVLDSLEIGTQ